MFRSLKLGLNLFQNAFSEDLISYIKFYFNLQPIQGSYPITFSASLTSTFKVQNYLNRQYEKLTLHLLLVVTLWVQPIHEENSVNLTI